MKTFTTLRNGGTVTVSPKNEAEQSGLVVICHGLGDSAEGFVDVAEVCDSINVYLHFTLFEKVPLFESIQKKNLTHFVANFIHILLPPSSIHQTKPCTTCYF
jgi:hypothetical protein